MQSAYIIHAIPRLWPAAAWAADEGPRAAEWLAGQCATFAVLRPLCLALKALLSEQRLNDASTGGLRCACLGPLGGGLGGPLEEPSVPGKATGLSGSCVAELLAAPMPLPSLPACLPGSLLP